jgi:hypothetical protein
MQTLGLIRDREIIGKQVVTLFYVLFSGFLCSKNCMSSPVSLFMSSSNVLGKTLYSNCIYLIQIRKGSKLI